MTDTTTACREAFAKDFPRDARIIAEVSEGKRRRLKDGYSEAVLHHYSTGWNAALATVQTGGAFSPERPDRYWPEDGGDRGFDCPDDAEIVDGLELGATFKVDEAYYFPATYRVTKVADETSDDVEVERLAEALCDAECEPGESAWAFSAESERRTWVKTAELALRLIAAPTAPATVAQSGVDYFDALASHCWEFKVKFNADNSPREVRAIFKDTVMASDGTKAKLKIIASAWATPAPSVAKDGEGKL